MKVGFVLVNIFCAFYYCEITVILCNNSINATFSWSLTFAEGLKMVNTFKLCSQLLNHFSGLKEF